MATFIYVRQSVGHPEGIDRGLARCRALVADRGWPQADEFVDNAVSASGVRDEKTSWGRMLAVLKPGDTVVGVDLDRLVRGIGDLSTLINLNARVITVDGEMDLTTADGELRATILAGMARFETRRKGERQKRANLYRISQGRPVPGRRRFGYEPDNTTPRPVEAEQVVAMFEAFASGTSLRTLSKVYGWRIRRVADTLRNRSYFGFVRHRGEWFPSDAITPLVSEELGEKVAAIFADPSRRTSPGPVATHLLSGLATCGICHERLHFMRNYKCAAGVSGHPCIRKEFLEEPVMREVVSALLHGRPEQFRPVGTPDIAAVSAALTRGYEAEQDVMELLGEGLVSKPVARERLAKIKAERAEAERIVEQSRAEQASVSIIAGISTGLLGHGRIDMTQVVEARQSIRRAFDELTLDRQRELVRGLLSIEVFPGRTAERIHIEHKIVTQLNEQEEAA